MIRNEYAANTALESMANDRARFAAVLAPSARRAPRNAAPKRKPAGAVLGVLAPMAAALGAMAGFGADVARLVFA